MSTPDERDSPRGGKSEADARRERLSAQLRVNLKRRKAQSKARRVTGHDSDPSEETSMTGEDDRR